MEAAELEGVHSGFSRSDCGLRHPTRTRTLTPANATAPIEQRPIGVSLGVYGMWVLEGIALAVFVLLAAPAAAQSIKPNIILIIADDLGYGDVGYLGSQDIRTPNIDALAGQSVIFDQGYVTASVCSPSRAGMVTGKYQQRFGHDNNIPPESADPQYGLPLNQVTMADMLKSAGYTTAAFGKWHLGAASQFHPRNRGFDYFYGWLGSWHSYFRTGSGSQALQRNGSIVDLNGQYMTDALTDDALAYMDRTPGPFFMHVAYNAPHSPLEATDGYLQRYPKLAGKRRVYAAMVSALDDGVGKIVAKADGLQRPTVIVFISDNGAVPKWGGNNGVLRGNKGSTWEGGIRVPWVMRLPGIAAGIYRQPVMSFDLLPTFAELAGAKTPEGIDGVSLLPYLRQEAGGVPHDVLFWRMNGDTQNAARRGNTKTVQVESGDRSWLDLSDKTEHTPAIAEHDLLGKYEKWKAGLPGPKWQDP
jgi:arylsulfatase A-like enzyme